jgi:hypothetical protein
MIVLSIYKYELLFNNIFYIYIYMYILYRGIYIILIKSSSIFIHNIISLNILLYILFLLYL